MADRVFQPPWRGRRLVAALRRTDNTDLQLLQQELKSRERRLQDAVAAVDRLRTELKEARDEARALRRVAEATGSAFDLEEMLKVTADIAVQITGTDSCQVYLFDPSSEELVLRAADRDFAGMVGKIRLKLGEGITGWAAQERKPVSVSRRAYQDSRFKFFPEMLEGEYESMLSVPLLTRGAILGVINVRTRGPRDYTRNQVRLVSGIANQVAGAIERSRRVRQLERHADQLQTLSEVGQAITSNMYLEELLHLFVGLTARTMGYSSCTVLLSDDEGGEIAERAAAPDQCADPIRAARRLIAAAAASRAMKQQNIFTVTDLNETEDLGAPDLARRAGVRSVASVPLRIHRSVIGSLVCMTDRSHIFGPEEILILQTLATQAALAIEHAKLMVKTAVVQEMHHRIKNNLQQIVSLIRLETRFSAYTTVEDALNDTLSRILAIASVHELLTRDNLDSVTVKQVAESILHAAQQSVVPPGKTIHTRVDGEDFTLHLSEATSMALVLNELVLNAVEHGFRTLDEGRIHIHLGLTPGERQVKVTNDGEPLPEGFAPTGSDRLGLSIVETLVRGDLKGSFSIENSPDRKTIQATVLFPR